MNFYCTLFDSNYLTRGLAMYQSICETGEEFTLYIFCFDDLAYEVLSKLNLKNIQLVSLSDFENDKLLRVKTDRTKAEYCWTCTSFVIRHCLDFFGLTEVTYIDADLYFFNKPCILLDEFHKTGKSVMITEHRYTPEYDQSKTSGIYCVQFMTFKSDEKGLEVLQWWQDRCIEWCYCRFEEGKFGDQKYLDNWTQMFEGIHVLGHIGGGVAPWNVQQYEIIDGPMINGQPIIFYHFHGLKWRWKYTFDLSQYRITRSIKKRIYAPYTKSLIENLILVREIDNTFVRGIVTEKININEAIIIIKRILLRSFKVIKRKYKI